MSYITFAKAKFEFLTNWDCFDGQARFDALKLDLKSSQLYAPTSIICRKTLAKYFVFSYICVKNTLYVMYRLEK